VPHHHLAADLAEVRLPGVPKADRAEHRQEHQPGGQKGQPELAALDREREIPAHGIARQKPLPEQLLEEAMGDRGGGFTLEIGALWSAAAAAFLATLMEGLAYSGTLRPRKGETLPSGCC